MEKSDRPVLYVGPQDGVIVDAVAHEAGEAGLVLHRISATPEVADHARSLGACALVIPVESGRAEDVLLRVRTDPRLSTVPVIGVVPEIGDLKFVELYSWGGDDLVGLSQRGGIARRLRLIPRDLPHRAVPPRGTVVVADDDQRRRIVLARVLRNAGFDARFALDAKELSREACSDGVVLVVSSVDIPSDGAVAAVKDARSRGCTVPWIIAAPPKRFGWAAAKTAGLEKVMLYDAFAPTENALFCANEALRGNFAEQRATPRLLFGTTIAFRQAGRESDEHGYAYNVSGEGLYVRTLAPPESGSELWIEMQPPRTERRVRLEGKVVWRRLLGSPEGATVPPGFGLRISGGSETDRTRFRQGYEAFRSDLAAARLTEPPAP